MSEEIDIPEGFKQTKIGLIPKDWSVETFSYMADFKNGLNYSKDEKGNGLKIIGVGDFQQNTSIQYGELEQVSLNNPISSDYLLKNNDLLFVRSNGNKELIGRVLLITNLSEDVSHSGFTIRARLKNGSIDPSYYAYVFKSSIVKNQFHKLGSGTNISNLSQQILGGLRLPYPQYQEQQKIATLLKTWDKAIEHVQNIIDNLRLRNKGLAKQLLTGRKRLKGFDGEWVHNSLEHYFDERKDTGFTDLPLLSVGESGVYPQNESNKKDTSNVDKSKYKRIFPGDIGYNTMRMWQGRSALSTLDGIVSPAYTIVTPKNNANAEFFAYLFKLDEVIHKFFRNSQGLVSDTLNCKFKDFKIVKVDVPSTIEEQRAIAQVLSKASQEVQLYEKKLTILQEQKIGLMQKLLTGEIRVTV